MQFIHFIDAALKQKVLKEGLPLHPNHRKINKESSGIFCYPLIKLPFRAPVLEEDYGKEDYLAFKQTENLRNESLSMEEAWAVVGAPRVTRRDEKVKKVARVIFELEAQHWPITVFINIPNSIGKKFAQILEDKPNPNIVFDDYKNNLLKTVRRIESKRYVIVSAPFTVATEADLLDLIDRFQAVGGGLWQEDSFECMLTKTVSRKSLKNIVEL